MTAVWKIPRRWRTLALPDRTALYPALYLGWTGMGIVISREVPAEPWERARLRVIVSDGALDDDERELMARAAARGPPVILAPQASLPEADKALAAGLGVAIVRWTDPGPLSSAPPRRPHERVLEVSGCAARLAEDRLLTRMLDCEAPAGAPPRTGGLVIAAGTDAAAAEIWPAVERRLRRTAGPVTLVIEDGADVAALAGLGPFDRMDPADPGLLARIGAAEAFLCAFPASEPESPRPGQWARTALFAGAPVIAASHPSLDGLAHLCVLDDWERGLELYGRFPAERLRAVAAAQAELSARLEPDSIARTWAGLNVAPRRWPALAPRKSRPPPAPPLLLVLIDIHQDLDVLLPVLLALKARREVGLRIAVTAWLLTESPRVLNTLKAHGFEARVFDREAVRAGDQPSLAGVAGVLSGAETNTRAHKAGHTLVGRARARGLPTFTLQHGFENIGLTYKDHLHGEGIRFAAETIFTWGAAENLASWAAPETRAAVIPVGSPKAAPAPARAPELNQGRWPFVVGVFENLHWHRFSELYLEKALGDLERAALAHEDTLFLVKPHHAGRWLSRHPERLRARPNLVVIDPTDSAWEPHTAPALIAGVDRVLTTPSTVALDAARSGRPVAVLGYDLELPLYEPLPIIRGLSDIDTFLAAPAEDGLRRNESFLQRAALPGRADHRIAARIAEALRDRRGVRFGRKALRP